MKMAGTFSIARKCKQSTERKKKVSKVPTWVSVDANGLITEIHKSKTCQPGMIEWPWNSDAKLYERFAWYKNGMRMTDRELIKSGIRIDNRGKYWNKNNYDEILVIRNLDEKVPEGFTKVPENIEKKNEIAGLKNRLNAIDEKAKAGRAVRKAAIDMGEMLSAIREVAIDFGNIAKELGHDPEENAALKVLIGFDPAKNSDLQKIAEWEEEAEAVREQLRPLLKADDDFMGGTL
jgi:hypothetical protein